MFVHICEVVTLVLGAVTTGVGTQLLYRTGRYPYSWHHAVPVPKFVDEPFVIHGDDYIGLI